LCLIIARRPTMKAEIPAPIPASIVSARAGRAAISARMVWPAGTDSYSEPVNDEPMTNKIGIAAANATVHLPNVVLGVILQGRLVMLSSVWSSELCNRCRPTALSFAKHPEVKPSGEAPGFVPPSAIPSSPSYNFVCKCRNIPREAHCKCSRIQRVVISM